MHKQTAYDTEKDIKILLISDGIIKAFVVNGFDPLAYYRIYQQTDNI